MVKVQTHSDKNQTQIAAKKAVEKLFTDNKEIPILFLISGGSCHDITQLLSNTDCDSRVTMGVLDERFTTDPSLNNFVQLSQTEFFKGAVINGSHVIDTTVTVGISQQDFAKQFEKSLRTWVSSHPNGVIIALTGIGRDGHTSGIIANPTDEVLFQKQFDDPNVWIVGYDAVVRNPVPLRVTTTFPFLRRIDHAVCYVQGPEKKQALTDVFAPSGALVQTPGRIIHEMKDCLVLTDQIVG